MMGELYQAAVTGAIEEIFPLITTCRKSTDLPWINAKIRAQIRRRKAIFCASGRAHDGSGTRR